jgi:hypothetical protein
VLRISDPQYLREQQYGNSSNLEARIALHARFSLNPYGWYLEPIDFTLESGQAQLAGWFGTVELHRYRDGLVVTEVEPLVDYILSTVRLSQSDRRRANLRRFIQEQMELNGGTIDITKDSGIFIAGI